MENYNVNGSFKKCTKVIKDHITLCLQKTYSHGSAAK